MGLTIAQIPDVLAEELALNDLLEIYSFTLGRSVRMEARWLPGRRDGELPVARLKATATDVLFGRSSAGAGAGEQIPCTAAGRQLIAVANIPAAQIALELEPGVDVQEWDAFLQSLADAGDLAEVHALLNLEPGVDVQEQDAFLQDLADAADMAAVRALLGLSNVRQVQFTLGDGTNVLTAGVVAFTRCAYAGTIVAARASSIDAVGAAVAGDVAFEIWAKSTGIPVAADKISASAPVSLAAAAEADTTLTGWTTAIAANSRLIAKVNSAATVKQVIVTLDVVEA
jgi:hypothetical protein